MYNFIDSRNAPHHKVPIGIANLGGTDEAKNIVTKNGDDPHHLSEHHDER